VFVEVKRHVAELADLTEQEAQVIGLFTSRIAKALLCTEAMEHVYTFFIGDGVPHVHIHVIGRYPNAPREYWGPKVDEWPEAPKGKENNWIETVSHKSWLPVLRLYGPLEPWFDKSWKPDDIVKI
jgi:diadenosine tetraphosphate (Ap4A) HIT family hydrolase